MLTPYHASFGARCSNAIRQVPAAARGGRPPPPPAPPPPGPSRHCANLRLNAPKATLVRHEPITSFFVTLQYVTASMLPVPGRVRTRRQVVHARCLGAAQSGQSSAHPSPQAAPPRRRAAAISSGRALKYAMRIILHLTDLPQWLHIVPMHGPPAAACWLPLISNVSPGSHNHVSSSISPARRPYTLADCRACASND